MNRGNKIIIKYNHRSEREHNGLTTSKNSELCGVHTVDKTFNAYSITRITQPWPYWVPLQSSLLFKCSKSQNDMEDFFFQN
jgi:hypothetical protein